MTAEGYTRDPRSTLPVHAPPREPSFPSSEFLDMTEEELVQRAMRESLKSSIPKKEAVEVVFESDEEDLPAPTAKKSAEVDEVIIDPPAKRSKQAEAVIPTLESLPAEPTDGPMARIQARLPDGKTAKRTFKADDPVCIVYCWVSALLASPHPLAHAYYRVLTGEVESADLAAAASDAVATLPAATWDILRIHPANSIGTAAAEGTSFSEAGLTSTMLQVQTL